MISFSANLTTVPASSTWSAPDASSTGMTLTNGGLTVTTSVSSWNSIRATTSHASGKFYVELFFNAAPSTTQWCLLGFASSSFTINSYLGTSNYSMGFQPHYSWAGSSGFTAGNVGSMPNPATNDVWALAIDFAAGKIWVSQNNVWLFSGSPAAGTGPAVTFTPATVGALFPAMSLNNGPPSGTFTLQPTAASQTYAPPAGFIAWDATAINYVDLAGGIAPSVSFSAALTRLLGFAGNLAPAITFSATLTSGVGPNYVDFAGNIGSVSLYGKLLFGQALYSRDPAMAPVFTADIDLVGVDYFAGNLAPQVTFSANLTIIHNVDFAGDLAPQVAFNANLNLDVVLAGDLPPAVTFNADVSIIVSFNTILLDGGFYFTVMFADTTIMSGPLWPSSTPCPPPMWTPSEPCVSVDWEESELCNG